MNRPVFFGLFLAIPLGTALLAAALLSTPNSLTDHLVSRSVSRWAEHFVKIEGVQARISFQALTLSIRRVDLGALPKDKAANFEHFFKGFESGGRLILEDSRWMLMSKRGGLSVRMLGGRIGDAAVRGGFFLKDGKTQKLLTRIRVRADSLQPFSRLVDARFPQSRDGHRVAKLSSSGGRWVLWGSRGPVLEARWQ